MAAPANAATAPPCFAPADVRAATVPQPNPQRAWAWAWPQSPTPPGGVVPTRCPTPSLAPRPGLPGHSQWWPQRRQSLRLRHRLLPHWRDGAHGHANRPAPPPLVHRRDGSRPGTGHAAIRSGRAAGALAPLANRCGSGPHPPTAPPSAGSKFRETKYRPVAAHAPPAAGYAGAPHRTKH